MIKRFYVRVIDTKFQQIGVGSFDVILPDEVKLNIIKKGTLFDLQVSEDGSEWAPMFEKVSGTGGKARFGDSVTVRCNWSKMTFFSPPEGER